MSTPAFIRPDGDDLIRDGAEAITTNADATLAAITDAFAPRIASGVDLNNVTAPGPYSSWTFGAVPSILNRPPGLDNQFDLMVTRAGSGLVKQVATMRGDTDYQSMRTWIRYQQLDTWHPWFETQPLVPYDPNGLLIGSNSDLDDVTAPGAYSSWTFGAVPSILNRPPGLDNQFDLMVTRAGSGLVKQVATMRGDTDYQSMRTWIRYQQLDAWHPWFETTPETPATRTPIMAGWGSSTMRLPETQLQGLAGSWEGVYVNGARDGDRALHTAARLGSIPARITFPSNTIPASGTVTVTSDLPLRSTGTSSWTGTVSGIDGTLAVTDTHITFTRSTDGPSQPSPAASEFLPDLGRELRHADVHLFNIGKNSIGYSSGTADTKSVVEASVAYIQPMTAKHFLIIGHFNNHGWAADDVRRDRIGQLNQHWASTYGSRFVDLGAALYSADAWTWTGITPTAEDLAAQAAEMLPPSLSSDTAHLNEAGNSILVRLIHDHLTALNEAA